MDQRFIRTGGWISRNGDPSTLELSYYELRPDRPVHRVALRADDMKTLKEWKFHWEDDLTLAWGYVRLANSGNHGKGRTWGVFVWNREQCEASEFFTSLADAAKCYDKHCRAIAVQVAKAAGI